MAIVRPLVRTKNQILNDNVSGYVNWALDEGGMNRARILAELRRRYPNATRSAVENAYDHIISSRSSGRRQDRLPDAQRTDRTSTPINPNIPQAYRYLVRLEWVDPQSGERRYFNSIVDNARAMTNEELRAKALADAETVRQFSQHSNPRYQFQFPTATQIEFSVITVERKT